jgi:glutamate-1-semialdehyde aminotransferase
MGFDGFLKDVNNQIYDDFDMALGSVILGYKKKEWLQELLIPDGFNFSAPHPLESMLAEKLVRLIPSAEMVKFFKNGSDATEIAVRLARAYTGRKWIVSFGYHGFHDWYVSAIDRNKGVLPNYHIQCQDIDAINWCDNNIAAVILEPTTKGKDYISYVANKHGALVIFDEVLTGFRYHIGGLQAMGGTIPDLSCFGKCMANGLPLSAVVGRKDIMQLMDDGGVFASSTFGGETIALAVALETVKELENNPNKLWDIGGRWLVGIRNLIAQKDLPMVEIKGLRPRCGVEFKDYGGITAIEFQSLYLQELLKRGILTHGINNFCLAHTVEQIDNFLRCASLVFDILKEAIERGSVKGYLEKPIQTMFKR